ncbi:MAG: isochorismatase family protein [Rhodospirillaceae bacterium]|nr:isochorismatase family protein [Rhodospirillaceae bacterium]
MSELDVYRRQGFGNSSGFGTRPALLIVDFQAGFADPNMLGGGNIAAAVEHTKGLLAAFRRLGLPVAYTRVVHADDGADAGVFCLKSPSNLKLTEHAPASQIVAALAPRPGEYIVRKQQPSAFFGTGLHSWLTMQRVDTLIHTGCTTSGCVRASVVDGMSYNYRNIVATDCVGDRAIAPHEANLFDMGQKYADLMLRDEIVPVLETLVARRNAAG